MPDERVEAAIAHWAPRFTAAGVDPNDFASTTGRIERWEEWLEAWCDTGDVHRALGEEAEERGRRLSAGEAWVRAALCYHFAKFVWMLDPGWHRQATQWAIESLYRAHRLLDPTARCVEIPYDGARLAGNLRRPPGAGSTPLVLLVPGLDSTKEEFFRWEETFLARGLATFSLDGPGQGESGFATKIRPDYETAVSAALDVLDWDGPVGAAGVSLGGYYAPRAAAFEPRVRAVAAIGGPYNFGECWDGLPSLTRETFVHHSGARDGEEGRERALELDLSAALPRLERPLLVVFGKLDRLIPYEQAERVAAEAPRAKLVLYPEGNHVCNNIPYKYRPLVADWMSEQLGAERR